MRRVAVVSTGRSDYSIYRPLLQAIAGHPELMLQVLITGMHLDPRFGHTADQVEKDGFPIAARIPVLQDNDTPHGVAAAMAAGVAGFAAHYAASPPDLLVVLGDRFEMFAAALAAVPFNLPILHLHGGELSEGAMDDRFRHALTKISHLHGTATEVYRRRVIQLGEAPWRVLCCGALALDNLRTLRRLSRTELEERFQLNLSEAPLLVTLHPTTNAPELAGPQTDALLAALTRLDLPVVFTMPNADTAGSVIRARLLEFCRAHPRARWVENFGPEGYYSMLTETRAMVGNSSSGLLEAPSFALPVVNLGDRQKGRLRAANVIDAPFEPDAIVAAVQTALTPAFRAQAAGQEHFFGDGHAAERLVQWIASVPLDARLRDKSFHDL
jgi:UDP-hydrolysing UDP-N-acetyl-D-glucosamine 2-epimerase